MIIKPPVRLVALINREPFIYFSFCCPFVCIVMRVTANYLGISLRFTRFLNKIISISRVAFINESGPTIKLNMGTIFHRKFNARYGDIQQSGNL